MTSFVTMWHGPLAAVAPAVGAMLSHASSPSSLLQLLIEANLHLRYTAQYLCHARLHRRLRIVQARRTHSLAISAAFGRTFYFMGDRDGSGSSLPEPEYFGRNCHDCLMHEGRHGYILLAI
ncbi:hypothetical protein K458DRAFT_69739 [Lentithecium fluviatile CBS 122367]|uniref:Uncharacterized protein n=1 Tax=Lentithecium fluviatile CBS 122367 TaxID=1168545 RepID=A0A6G1JMA2_9PLEO|nr:hypothetical protein K458DRAFT_69739 [Lentithecium fluviatile CBS 122367]